MQHITNQGKKHSMLVEFSVENFLSFRDEQRFSLVAASDRARFEDTATNSALGNDRLLKSVVIYGPNAAGKSNLFRAIRFVKNLITNSLNRNVGEGTGVQNFRLDEVARKKSTKFEVVFIQNEVRYDYSLIVNASIIEEESLHAYPKGKPQLWYRRTHNYDIDQPELTSGRNLRGRLDVLRSFVRPNIPVIALAILSNQPQLTEVYRWFDEKLLTWFSEMDATANPVQARQLMTMIVANMPEIHESLSNLLQLADVGIQDLAVREDVTMSIAIDSNTELSPFSIHEEPQRRQKYVRFLHAGYPNNVSELLFSIEEESRGTQQLFMLGTILLNGLQHGQILIIDELDTSLHPQLVRALVELFHKESPNTAQLIFNTHDASLLRGKLFERDQIWFVEKDNQGGSQLYPLLDFQPQDADESLEEAYLHGRYGAVPLIERLTWQELQNNGTAP